MRGAFNLTADKKVLLWIIGLLAAIAAVLILTSCSVGEVYPYKSIERTPVNEKCHVYRNWWADSDVAFFLYVARMVNTIDYTRIRYVYWCGGNLRRGRVAYVVVYYE